MKVCYKAGAVTAQNHYYSIAADAVEIRVWFLTDDIIRIRAGFDGCLLYTSDAADEL